MLRTGDTRYNHDTPMIRVDNSKIRQYVNQLKTGPSPGNLPPMELWDTSGVDDMSDLFRDFKAPIGDIRFWDTSNVKDMSRMFFKAEQFDIDISQWDVSKVVNMEYMFCGARLFNQSLDGWSSKTRSVTRMRGMFAFTQTFNGSIGSWDVSNVEDMGGMFHAAIIFNQPLSGWSVASLKRADYMFYGAEQFNQDLSTWKPVKLEGLVGMFSSAMEFDQDLTNWVSFLPKTSGLQMSCMFAHTKSLSTIPGWYLKEAIPYSRRRLLFHGSKVVREIENRMSVGNRHALIVSKNGKIRGWGANTHGQLSVPDDDRFVAVSAGAYHSLALRDDGRVVCWGNNAPTQVVQGEFVAISAGGKHSLAIRRNGLVHCWGDNEFNQAPRRDVRAPLGARFVAVSAGSTHSMALTSFGATIIWGKSAGGAESRCWRARWFPSVVDISAGTDISLGLCDDGSIRQSGKMTQPPPNGCFLQVSAGADHAVALRADYRVVCWGEDKHGEAQPHDLPPGPVVAVSAAQYRTLVKRLDHRPEIWGLKGGRKLAAGGPQAPPVSGQAGSSLPPPAASVSLRQVWQACERLKGIPGFRKICSNPQDLLELAARSETKRKISRRHDGTLVVFLDGKEVWTANLLSEAQEMQRLIVADLKMVANAYSKGKQPASDQGRATAPPVSGQAGPSLPHSRQPASGASSSGAG